MVDTWSPPPEAASITPLSCDEIGEVFAYDPQAPLDIQEVGRRREEGVTLIDLTYASPMGGRVPATFVVPHGAGPFAGNVYGMIPAAGSPAIDAGNNAVCPTVDINGKARPVDGDDNGSAVCDMGAYERWLPTAWIYLVLILRG